MKTGLYTSPHLLDIRERIQVSGSLISRDDFAEGVQAIQKVLTGAHWKNEMPTYFELITALAFLHFKRQGVHVAVLEIGLGGLYDSTNIVNNKVAGITSLSLEHMDKLGSTLSEIAIQKCGIVKKSSTVVSSSQAAEAYKVIERTCQEKQATLFSLEKNFYISEKEYGKDYQRFDFKSPFGDYTDLEIQLLGRHQMENTGVAIFLAKALEAKTNFIRVNESGIRKGLKIQRRGCLEVLSTRPLVVLDGAHNADSMRKLLQAVKRHFVFKKIVAILGVSSDKDVTGILKELEKTVSVLITTQSSNPRAIKTKDLAQKAKNIILDVRMEENFEAAMGLAKELAREDDLILVTGSLFLVADVIGDRL